MERGFLREAIDRIVELAAPTMREWDGRMFTSKAMEESPWKKTARPV